MEAARRALESKLKQHDKDASVSHVDPKSHEISDKPTGYVHFETTHDPKHTDAVASHIDHHTHDMSIGDSYSTDNGKHHQYGIRKLKTPAVKKSADISRLLELEKKLEKAKEYLSSLEKKREETDKLVNRETSAAHVGDDDWSGSAKVHWRKPKSGETPIKLDSANTNNIKANQGDQAAPRAGKAHIGTTGRSHLSSKYPEEYEKSELIKFNTNGQWSLEKSKNSNRYWNEASGGNPEAKALLRRPGLDEGMESFKARVQQPIFQEEASHSTKTRKPKSGEEKDDLTRYQTGRGRNSIKTSGESHLNPKHRMGGSGSMLLLKDPDKYASHVNLEHPLIDHKDIDSIRSKHGIDPEAAAESGVAALSNLGASNGDEEFWGKPSKPTKKVLQ